MESTTRLVNQIVTVTLVAAVFFTLPTLATAKHKHHCCKQTCMGEMQVGTYKEEIFVPAWQPAWYAGANIGVSRTHDNPTTIGSVDNTGPAWSVDGGYQMTPIWGVEAGFTSYHESEDDSHSVKIASTEHYSVNLAVTGQYHLIKKLNALGKLGVAYSYARKDTPPGPTADAGSVSPYAGVGLEYNLTQTVDVIGQWARAWGNRYTGSTDLYSIGLKVALA